MVPYNKQALAPMSVDSVSLSSEVTSDLFFVSTYNDFDRLGKCR